MNTPKKYQSFSEFYPFYLSQHQDLTCRRLHFVGSIFVIMIAVLAIVRADLTLLFFLPIVGYGFAWIGHFFFEKNRPATFTYPIYSLIGDWVMFKDILIGRIKF